MAKNRPIPDRIDRPGGGATTGAGTIGLNLGPTGQFGNPNWTKELMDQFMGDSTALGYDAASTNMYVDEMLKGLLSATPQPSAAPATVSAKRKKDPLIAGLKAYAQQLMSSQNGNDATVNSQYDAVLQELLTRKGTADTAVNTGTTNALSSLQGLVNPYANMQLASTQNAVNPLAAFQAALGYNPDSQADALASLLSSQNQQSNNVNFNNQSTAKAGWDTINQAQQTQAGARGADALTANAGTQSLAALQAMGTRDAALNANAATRQEGINTLMTQLLTLAANGKDISSLLKILGGGKK